MSFVRRLKGRYPVSTMTVAPQKIANLIKLNKKFKAFGYLVFLPAFPGSHKK